MAQQTVRQVINRLCELMQVEGIELREVILFGSHAKGLARRDSDIDLCVVVDAPDAELKTLQSRLNFIAARQQLLVDVIVTNTQQLENNLVSPLLHEIRTYGKVMRTATRRK